MSNIAKTPKPPYYAVIFTSLRTDGDHGYDAMAQQMAELSADQQEFLGMEHARAELGITICYWSSLEAIENWKNNLAHKIAQEKGREIWYQSYAIRICKVERDTYFERQ